MLFGDCAEQGDGSGTFVLLLRGNERCAKPSAGCLLIFPAFQAEFTSGSRVWAAKVADNGQMAGWNGGDGKAETGAKE